jgi:hypothetical protein
MGPTPTDLTTVEQENDEIFETLVAGERIQRLSRQRAGV